MKRFLVILSVLCFFACSTDVELALIGQEEKIDAYISKTNFNDSSVVFRNKGVNRVSLGFVHDVVEKTKDTIIYGVTTQIKYYEDVPIKDTVYIDYGDSIYIYYAGYVFTSSPSTLFATNVKEVAEAAR